MSKEQQDEQNLPSQDVDKDKILEQVEANIDVGVEATEVEVQPAQFGDIGADVNAANDNRNVQMLLDVELNVVVELGRKTMMVSDVLNLGKGSVVELPKAAGEPLDILINGTRLARGEVVVIDEHFAVRITELAAPRERIKSLG